MKKLLYGIGIVSFVLGVACGIVGLFDVYPFQRFPWLFVIPAFLLAVLFFRLAEVLERLEDQELKLLALRDSLEKLMKQDGLLAEGPQQCRRCGTQLPPGGKTCPTCHYVNE